MLYLNQTFSFLSLSLWRKFSRALVITFAAFLLGACIEEGRDGAIDGPPPSRDWVLVWSDEFDGTELDLDNWEIQLGDGKAYGLSGWGNNEEQYYTADNISVSGGNLVITSEREDFTGVDVDPVYGDPATTYPYTSARIRTSGKFEFTYGRVEGRIKMPATKGIWNAFWLLGSEMSPYGGWPAKGEIDILEAYKRGDPNVTGNDPFFSAAAHFGAANGPDRRFTTKAKAPFDHFSDFHVYAIEWDAEEIRWFVDGENWFSLRKDNYWNYYDDAEEGFQAGGDSAPFDEDQYIILNAAVGGNLANDAGEPPNPATFTSDEMLIDYVRVYECPFDPATGTGCKNKVDQTDEFQKFEFPPQRAFSALFDYFIDGPGPETLPTGKTLVFTSSGVGLVYQELTEANGNTYIDVVAPPGSLKGFGFKDSLDEDLIIGGFPGGLGDLKFDLYIEADSTTNGGSSTANILVSIRSGGTFTRKFFPLADFQRETWQRVTVPISELLANQNTGIRWDEISEVVRFEFFSSGGDGEPIHVRIDNVQFACGGGSACGIVDEVPVFTNMVEPFWDRGIVGNDQDQVTAANADYTVNDQFHVQWREYDTMLNGFDTVVETTFGTTGAVGAVNFVGATNPVATIGALVNGEFRFDIRMRQNPNNVELFFKIDGESSSTGEQPLGPLPIDTWVRFSCPIATLAQQGLDIGTVTAPFVLVPGNNGAGQGVVVEWDNVTFSPIQTGSSTVINVPIVFDNLPGFCLPVASFEGGAFAVVDNPDPDLVNSNSRVGRTIKFENFEGNLFGGIAIVTTDPIQIGPTGDPAGKAFKIKAYSARVGMKVTFKLDNSGVGPERIFETTVANDWQEFELDFNGEAPGDYAGITLIIDNGTNGDGINNPDDWTLYFDQIEQIDSTSSEGDLTVVYDYDQPNTTYPLFDFGEARSEVTAVFPADSGPPEAASGNVGKVTLNDFAQNSNGTILGGQDGFETAIPFTASRTTIRARVYAPRPGTLTMKVEDVVDSFQAAELTKVTSSGWQTLDFNFADVSINTADSFEKMILIFDAAQAHNGEEYYWDNIELLP